MTGIQASSNLHLQSHTTFHHHLHEILHRSCPSQPPIINQSIIKSIDLDRIAMSASMGFLCLSRRLSHRLSTSRAVEMNASNSPTVSATLYSTAYFQRMCFFRFRVSNPDVFALTSAHYGLHLYVVSSSPELLQHHCAQV